MTWVDLAILAIVAWNVANGVRRGFLWSAVDLVVFLLSISIALTWNGWVTSWAAQEMGIRDPLVQPVVFVLIWIIAGLLLRAAGEFLVRPFQFLLWGSTGDLLLGTVPSAARGFAIGGFGIVLVLAPPSFIAGTSPGILAGIQEAIQQSQLAPRVAEGLSLYERWVGHLVPLPQDMAGRPTAGQQAAASSAIKRVLPNSGVPSPQQPEAPAKVLPTRSVAPTTGQGFPREVYDALGVLDRAGDAWVRDTVNRWVTSIRFVPGGDAAGHLPGTGYFGQMSPKLYLDGVYYSEIIFAQGQSQRDRFFAGWLAHEATHVLQTNTDLAAYKNCAVRESQAYLLQGYVLLDLFGQDLEAIRRAPGVYPHEVRYATAAKSNDIDAMVRYSREIGECP